MSLLLREADVAQLLDMDRAIDHVESSFALLASGGIHNFPRRRGGTNGALLNVMWAIAPALSVMGVKTYPVVRTDTPQAATSNLVLYDMDDGRLRAILDAEVLGQRRTGAASAVATRHLARASSRTLAVFGAGWQAQAQVSALARVMDHLAQVFIVNRSPERGRRFAELIEQSMPDVRVVSASGGIEEIVRSADVIVTATGASEPLFDGTWVRPGTHINAIGSNYDDKRELDRTILERASVIAVDEMEVARLECGDLIRNGIALDRAVELGEIVVGKTLGRSDEADITVFESHGLAAQDIACGQHVAVRAASEGVGLDVPVGELYGERSPLLGETGASLT